MNQSTAVLRATCLRPRSLKGGHEMERAYQATDSVVSRLIPQNEPRGRRTFVKSLAALAGSAALLGYDIRRAASEPPETTTIRIMNAKGFICVAPQWVAQELLRLEGFTDIRYV